MAAGDFAISAQGTIIRRSADPNWPQDAPTGNPVSFVDVGKLMDINPPDLTRKAIETTDHNQSDDQYIVGIRRHGDMTFKVNFHPQDATHDHHTGLQKAWFDGTRDIYEVEYPDGTSWFFSGFVTGFKPSDPVDDKLVADVTIRPTGRHAWVDPV